MIYGQDFSDQDFPCSMKLHGAPKDPSEDKKSGHWDTFKRFFYEFTKGKFGFGVGPLKMEMDIERERDGSDKNQAEIEKMKNPAASSGVS